MVLVGKIEGAFGVRGEIRVRAYTSPAENIVTYGPLRDAAGQIVLTPSSFRRIKDALAVRAPEVREREEAEALRGVELHAPRAAFPEPDEDEFYIVDLIGCAAFSVTGAPLGVVIDAPNYGAGDILLIRDADGALLHVPFTRLCIPEIDLAARRIMVDPPETIEP